MKGKIVTKDQLIIGNKYYFEYTGEAWHEMLKTEYEGVYECKIVDGNVDLVNEYEESVGLTKFMGLKICLNEALRTTIYEWVVK